MKTTALLSAAVLVLTVAPVGASIEALRHSASLRLSAAAVDSTALLAEAPEGVEIEGSDVETPPAAGPQEPTEPVIVWPKVEELPSTQGAGRPIGSFKLTDRLDGHRDLFTLKLGQNDWWVSLAGDAKFEVQYITFQRGSTLVLARVKDPNELRGKGITVKIDEKTTYLFKVSINIFNPVRGSTLKIDPVAGTQGPSHKIKTGDILDAVKRESYVFNAGGKEFWTLFGTDVDPATDKLADTRSLLFIQEAGTSSKAYPLAEGRLAADAPLSVALGDVSVVMTKTLGGELRINESAKSSGAAASR